MMMELEELFSSYAGTKPDSVQELAVSGSNRRYFRMRSGDRSFIGVEGEDEGENRAFISLGRHFRQRGLSVPQVYAVSSDGMCYLQEDLGSVHLFDMVAEGRATGKYSAQEEELLLKTVSMLPKIQFEGADGLDFGVCYPEASFGRRTVMSDLNYFKFCFLKASGIPFQEVSLDADFEALASDLTADGPGYAFMYRDFQSRNVMLKDGEPYFIDFQGGRRGPCWYDLASFVWQAKARYPDDLKERMAQAYRKELQRYIDVDETEFREKYRLFVLFRTLQVLGAYGFRGYFERKPHFLESIPFAICNLKELLETPFEKYPYLNRTLARLVEGMAEKPAEPGREDRLTVDVCSFSYKKGLPEDRSGNGGGYIFDCRAIHNPGKYERYRSLTGMDPEVAGFLEKECHVDDYLAHVFALADSHVETFIRRGFTHLSIGFGCTGGQHRSVYCAERMARHLAEKYDVDVILTHREQHITILDL